MLASDIQAILTVLGRRTRTSGREEDKHLDLARIALRGANLRGAQLERAALAEARLEGADLRGARLERANLDGAYLNGAYLKETTGLTVAQLSTIKI
jgi:uncharacterized protein YjbI with pentapeptide repeats